MLYSIVLSFLRTEPALWFLVIIDWLTLWIGSKWYFLCFWQFPGMIIKECCGSWPHACFLFFFLFPVMRQPKTSQKWSLPGCLFVNFSLSPIRGGSFSRKHILGPLAPVQALLPSYRCSLESSLKQMGYFSTVN